MIESMKNLWFGLLVGVTRFSDAAPAALVLFPGKNLLSHLPQGVAVTGRTTFSVTLRSTNPALAERLYRAGAWVVLPAGLDGCLTR